LIVPNKEFITGRLQNWTLSDQVLRIVVPVSLAFESDVASALSYMLDAAHKHPNVMQDPAPQAALVSFSNSALNFELRVYTPGIGVMGGVQHDLHATIHDSLVKANIQLARTLNDTRVSSFPESSNGKSNGSGHIKMAG
jgi:potassium efflux system protein